MRQTPSLFWQRAIILVDMNSFFAAIEQLDNPEWRGLPLAVTNGQQGTCIITGSYEARAYGIKTGMRIKEALMLCPSLKIVSSRPKRYIAISTAIMEALATLTPDLEIFSIDEAFLDVTRCQQLWGSPETIGRLAQQKVYEASRLRCSIGVSGDKTTAKYAAKLQKPHGFTVIPPWEAKAILKNVPVTELCGIGNGIGNFLNSYGVYNCGDIEKLPISILAKRFGNLGRRIWYMCQGADPESVKTIIASPKSLGHGKVMQPTRDKETILIYLRHMCEKVTARLRQHQLEAQHFYIGWKHDNGWMGDRCKTPYPTQDGQALFQLGKRLLETVWHNALVFQVQVTALDPAPFQHQADLFASSTNNDELHHVIDAINSRYGDLTIMPAPLLHRSSMNNVISPAWKPYGHRQSIL